MPSFDVSSEMNWQELDNAINQATKEISQRFDFKGIKTEIKLDQKAKTVTLWCSEEGKLDSVVDVLQGKLVKRGISLLSFDYKPVEPAFGGSVRQVVAIQAGISKEKGKEVIAALKDSKLKVQAQIQDEQVRVTGKNRDDLQAAIALLREKQDQLKVPMQFGNFRN
ncbi:MAG: YajQ family cyclic di-GMP-binding protein [Bdellovibrionales bacterium RIFOXYC1_FULL_54_43]|nr:MAG: YajQ family cyclic di-GMP-binding protein [Bdellovibrionales bacterium RIFOXYC1_FULL_54_43]OFZ85056.1 MAG: YajQ family cyclic di-GMP-binding protein [Bdellovibrionales bacterium RIFOXYD1_FULL_55_31]